MYVWQLDAEDELHGATRRKASAAAIEARQAIVERLRGELHKVLYIFFFFFLFFNSSPDASLDLACPAAMVLL